MHQPLQPVNLDPGQTTSFGSKFVGGLAPGNWDWLNVGQGKGASALGSSDTEWASGSYSVGTIIVPRRQQRQFRTSEERPMRQTVILPRLDSSPPLTHARTADLSRNECSGGRAGFRPTIRAWLRCLRSTTRDATAQLRMPIEGFAEIYLEQNTTGTDIEGCFVKPVKPNTTGSAGAPDLGSLGQPILTN